MLLLKGEPDAKPAVDHHRRLDRIVRPRVLRARAIPLLKTRRVQIEPSMIRRLLQAELRITEEGKPNDSVASLPSHP
jgi:hypothetical protein